MRKLRLWSTMIVLAMVFTMFGHLVPAQAALSQPTVKIGTTKTTKEPRINITEVNGATGYRIYRKTPSDKKWVPVTTTKKLSYVDTQWTAEEGKKIKYTVKAYKKNGGKTTWSKASTTTTWTVPKISKDAVLYEDKLVKIVFSGAKTSKYYDDCAELEFHVTNKTDKNITIQGNCLSVNGVSYNKLIVSDDIGAKATGKISVEIEGYDFDAVPLNAIRIIGGQFDVLDTDSFDILGYAIWDNTYVCSGTTAQVKAPSLTNKVYEDANCVVYYDRCEKYKYSDDQVDMIFKVTNKMDQTIEFQADTVTINETSYNRLIMSDPVAMHSTGEISLSINDVTMDELGIIKKLGGSFYYLDNREFDKIGDCEFVDVKVK